LYELENQRTYYVEIGLPATLSRRAANVPQRTIQAKSAFDRRIKALPRHDNPAERT
jgi:hypothetical protein